MNRLQNLLVPVDFSDYSRTALMQAVWLAAWNQADRHALHSRNGPNTFR